MRLSLISKLAISTSAVLIFTMALFAYINIEQLEKLLLEEAVADADRLSETIIRTTHYQMLENDRKRVYETIKEAGSQQGVIERIRMINKDGLILFSTDEKEIGSLLDKKAAACNMCHSGEKPLVHASSMNRSRIFTDGKGNSVLGLAKAIYNQASCSTAACHFHPADAKVLGVLDVIVSLEPVHNRIYSYRNEVLILTILQIALISLCLTFFIQKLVNRPVHRLLEHTTRLGMGELDTTVKIQSDDELGELAASFNEMTKKLKRARNELEDWGRNLEVKVEERTQEIQKIQRQLIHSEKLASLGELVAGIAHEINNPLTGILVFSSLLSDDPKLDPSLKSDLEMIVRETQRCAKIVKGLLDFSRESTPHMRPTPLNGIMDASLTLVSHQSSFHDITILREYNPDIPDLLLDPNQMEQVFINILLNASHAMPDGGQVRIRSGIDSAANQAYVSISDTGCGIPEDIKEKIFDPFFTTKENKGTGLGLSVSYGIIESHGGMIEVESEINRGTTFTIRLPLTRENQSPPDAPEAGNSPIAAAPDTFI